MDKCDAFVERVNKQWKRRKPEDWLKQPVLTALTGNSTGIKSTKATSALSLKPSAKIGSTSRDLGKQRSQETSQFLTILSKHR